MAECSQPSRPRRPFPILLGLLALGGCAHLPPSCPTPSQAAVLVQLFFGLDMRQQGSVSNADFDRFLDEAVAPRFPHGFTVLDAEGRWRPATGASVRERSKVLILAVSDNAQLAGIDAIRSDYRAAFRQESVMKLTQPTCVTF